MNAAPEGRRPGPIAPESLRREVDREVVGLLRRNHEDNRQVIALLSQVVDLLRESRAAAPSCAETGVHAALN